MNDFILNARFSLEYSTPPTQNGNFKSMIHKCKLNPVHFLLINKLGMVRKIRSSENITEIKSWLTQNGHSLQS